MVALLVVVLAVSLYNFFRNEQFISISLILLFLLISGAVQYWKVADGTLLAISSSFLLAYSSCYLLFATPASTSTVTLGFVVMIGLVYYLLLAPPIAPTEAGILLFITATAFLISLYLPTDLFNVALLSTLPVMLATPALVRKTTPIVPIALHVTITGLLGASLICLTAVLFI